MRPILLALLLIAPLAAGCVTPSDPAPGVTAPPAGAAFVPDCSVAPLTAAWPDPCTALASPNDSPSKAEIDLVVNPTNPLNIVVGSKDLDRAASDCVWSVAQVTKDGGKTWKTSYVAGDKAGRVPELAGFACITDPIMAFDNEGVLYYALQAYDVGTKDNPLPVQPPVIGSPTEGSAFILARSQDGGETWDNYVVQHLGDGGFAFFHDYPRMLYNPETDAVHTIWNGIGAQSVFPFVSTTRDGGETVDPPVTFYSEEAPTGTQFFSGFALHPSGDIYVTAAVTTGSDAGDKTPVHLFKSTDDARTFTEIGKAFEFTPTPRQFGNHSFRTPSFVEMAIDRSTGSHSGRIYTFYPDFATGDSDLMMRWSDDGAVTWSEPIRVNVNASGDQLMMRPTVGADGIVHVLYYTNEHDPNRLHLDVCHAWSADGGLTWRNQRLTASSFDGDKGIHQDGPPFIGDYNGIAVGPDGVVHAAWGDTRTGRAEIAYARILPPTTA